MIFGKIKADTPVPPPHVIPDVEKKGRVTSEGQEKAHTDNTISRVSHVIKCNNSSKMIKMDMIGTSKTHK